MEPAASADTKALERRADAARQLVAAGQIDPELALSYIVWPSMKLNQASRQGPRPFPDRLADAVDLIAQGHGQATASDTFGTGRHAIQEHLSEHDLQTRLRV